MHVLNIHSRTYDLSKDNITNLLNTLSNNSDEIWPKEKWPRMKLDDPGKQIVFRFTHPKEFKGVHKFDIAALDNDKTKLTHTIDMKVNALGYFKWLVAVKWLHDALIEDGLDKLYTKTTGKSKVTPWNIWVKILRAILK